jgi:hypothetical protein
LVCVASCQSRYDDDDDGDDEYEIQVPDTSLCVALKNVQHKNVDWKMNVFSLSLRWRGCYESCDGGVGEEEAVACLMMPYHLSRRLIEENHVNFTQTSPSSEFELGSSRIKKNEWRLLR